MPRPLTIIVGGYIVGYPLGGMTWHHLNYLLGLQAMGHDVWFLEDSGAYSVPYNPVKQICEADPAYGIEYLKRTFAAHDLPPRFCYYSQFWDKYHGLSRDELHDLLKRADLLLCVSGVTPVRADRPKPRRTAVVDTDPVFTQLRMIENEEFANYYKAFDAVATFGTLIGRPECPLPTHGLKWIPTCQPIALDHWPFVPATSRTITTIGKWEHSERSVQFAGQSYLSSKGPEWLKMLDLPARVPWEMQLPMLTIPGDVAAQFTAHGWKVTDPESATISTDSFREFVQNSAAEFTVAKQIYSGLPSGWFSDRSSCYLATGRPVVTQATGFDRWLPTGEGLFSFETVDEAAAALNAIAADHTNHSLAARAIAERFLDARKVLGDLLQAAL